MQLSSIVVLACLVSMAWSKSLSPAVDAVGVPEDLASVNDYESPALERSPRNKRFLLLKKKLLLGALGLKAAKVGAVGAAGVAGAIALKSHYHKPHHTSYHVIKPSYNHGYSYHSHGPEWNVQVQSWSH